MSYDRKSGRVIYRSKLHATPKRNYELMPALKWLRLLMNHIPDNNEHLALHYGYYSNRSRGAREQVQPDQGATLPTCIDESSVDARRKPNWA